MQRIRYFLSVAEDLKKWGIQIHQSATDESINTSQSIVSQRLTNYKIQGIR